MSTYFQAWSSTIDAPDPDDFTPEPPETVGNLCDGRPITQGIEGGVLHWNAMTLADWIDLWDTWNTNKANEGDFTLPGRTAGDSWTSWRTLTAYAEEPTCEYAGNQVHNVNWHVIQYTGS